MYIHDPIHGSIEIAPVERHVIDSRQFQRLRFIKQLGFADLAFPAATHTRLSHSIGAMAVASRLFDALYARLELHDEDRRRLRQTLRLSVLLHDLGHPPLSHTSERILPMRATLNLPDWLGEGEGERATHEDMTLLLILQSSLSDVIRRSFADLGIEPEHVASLVCGRRPPKDDPFRLNGIDHAPLLRQIVSSELDADRMDYLLRDSAYTGVHYGRYDLDWLVQNVTAVERGGSLCLGLKQRTVFAFEDFLLSRYHMFMSVYFHSTSINYEEILGRFYASAPEEFSLSGDPEEYVEADDTQLWSALRRSRNPWARRLVDRRGYHLAVEINPFEQEVDLGAIRWALGAEGIDHFQCESRGVLSKYFASAHEEGDSGPAPILVRTARGEWIRIEEYTPLFRRYAEAARLQRLYVDPDKRQRARQIAGSLARG